MTITSLNQLDLSRGGYTYTDYLLWQLKERVELLRGRIFKMIPVPAIIHQRISMRLSGEFYNFFKGKSCEVFTAPFDVVLPSADGKEDNVVQPDLCVVCDPEKLADGKRCLGAPDLVIEILSKGNSQRDLDDKFHLYEQAEVSEYWIVRPTDKEVNIFVLDQGRYRGLAPVVEGKEITSVKFPTLSIHTNDIFD